MALPGSRKEVASLVGALIGMRTGLQSIPSEWVDELKNVELLKVIADKMLENRATHEVTNENYWPPD